MSGRYYPAINAATMAAVLMDQANEASVAQIVLELCSKEDIGLLMSPAGLPGRALIANVDAIRERDLKMTPTCPTGCLRKCSYKSSGERFCIVHSLDRAQRGDTETGLVFCGTNAWKATRIETVAEIFEDLFQGEAPCSR